MNMQWIELLISGLVGLVVAVSLVSLIFQVIRRYGLPGRTHDPHHTHEIPVPRLGGVALAGALVSVVLIATVCLGPSFLFQQERWQIVAASLAMFGLGLWDDFFRLGAKHKLLGQLLIASAAYFGGIGIHHFQIPFVRQIIDLGLWGWPVTILWLVGMTNLINLIDGVDGLAGGICLMLMTLLVYVSIHAGLAPIMVAGMIGALVGFLKFNFPPARIYLGDGGAYFLGFMIGCLTIVTSQKGPILAALVAPLFVLALPIIDTSLAILRRGIRGLPLFRPDRKHIHHRLLAIGHSRRDVVLGLYGFTAFFLLLGFISFCWNDQHLPLMLGIGTLAIILAAKSFDFSREWFSIGRVLGNSLEGRSDVQYALSLSRWLALEGKRAETIEKLADDAVFIARKLGFSSIRICLDDDARMWQLGEPDGEKETLYTFRHDLPGHKSCFLELCVVPPDGEKTLAAGVPITSESTFHILSDLLAENWAKAIADWGKIHQSPARFAARPETPPPGEKDPGTSSGH